MQANLRAATVAASVTVAVRAAKASNGEHGYLVYADGSRAGETHRSATQADTELADAAAVAALDPDASFVVDGNVQVRLVQP